MNATYNITTFNLRFDNAADGRNRWACRKDNVLGMLSYYSWDVIGMQEVCGNQLEDLAELSAYSYVGIGREKDTVSEHGPIFYKKELFDLEDSGTFWLSLTPDVPSKSWEADCKRICTWVRLKDRRNDRAFIVLNTHLDHMSEEARFQGALLIMDWVKQLPSTMPVLLTGDFNAPPAERCYKQITTELRDTKRVNPDLHYGPEGTFTGFDHNISWEQLKQIDYIFVNQQVNVCCTRTIVDSFNCSLPSDHYPVTATVQF